MWLEELGVTERLVFYVFCAVAALDLVLALSVLVVGLIYRINTPGASLDFYIAFGSLALMVSTLIRGADPEWGTLSQLETLCVFYPSILTFGLLWFIGGLLLKACAIQNYFKYHSGDSVRAHEWKPNFWMILLMIVDAAIVLIWLIAYEPDLVARDPSGNPLQMNITLPEEHYYTCEGDKYDLWMIGVSALHAFLLLLAAIIIWCAVSNSRRTPASAEATLLSLAIYNTIFGVVGATLVHFYFDGSKSTTYAIVGGITFYVIFMALLLILIMKVVAARRSKYSNRDSHYDKVDDDRGRNSYRQDNYINETQLPRKKTKKKKEKKEKKPKVKKEKVKKTKVKKEKKVKDKSRKSKASSKSSKRNSGYHDRDNYENDRYESDRDRDRYDDYNDRERGSNRGSYYNDSSRGAGNYNDSNRGGGHYNDSQRSGHDNRGYESNRTSKVYNDSRGSYREERSYRDDRSDRSRGSYGRNSPEYRGSDRDSQRRSDVFAY